MEIQLQWVTLLEINLTYFWFKHPYKFTIQAATASLWLLRNNVIWIFTGRDALNSQYLTANSLLLTPGHSLTISNCKKKHEIVMALYSDIIFLKAENKTLTLKDFPPAWKMKGKNMTMRKSLLQCQTVRKSKFCYS